jgi:hypothetical protein
MSTPNMLDPPRMRTQAEDLAGGQGADAAQLGEGGGGNPHRGNPGQGRAA